MAKILFKIWSTVSHYNATFALAKSLQAHGHEVIYCGAEELRAYVAPEGFAFIAHEEKGIFNPFLGNHSHSQQSTWTRIKRLATTPLFHPKPLKPDTASAAFIKVALEERPDAILLDAHYTALALQLLKHALPFAILSTKPCLDRFPGLPPICSGFVPQPGARSRLWAYLLWQIHLTRRKFASLIARDQRFNKRCLARRSGRKDSEFETQRSLFVGIKCVPEFILSPREFDFPHPTKSHQHYVSGSPDLERTDPNYDVIFSARFASLRRARAAGRPLVYCSLGTISWRYPGMVEFLVRLISASDGQPWNLLLATGADVKPQLFTPLPDNVAVLQRVPQVEVLRETDVMVTHGGMNSIKECIALAVPMLVFPGAADIDQEGNSARVIYHGLGLRGRMRSCSTAQIRADLTRLLGDPRFKRAVRQMATLIENSDAHCGAAEIVENSLSLHPSYVQHTSS